MTDESDAEMLERIKAAKLCRHFGTEALSAEDMAQWRAAAARRYARLMEEQ